jgi:hypothetical protein
MTYVIYRGASAPHVQIGETPGFELKFSERKRLSEVTKVFSSGKALLDSAETPDRLQVHSRVDKLPDLFSSRNAILICSGRLRDLLEELDPGVHQFIPITVEQYSGMRPPQAHFILNVHYKQDSIVDELSDVRRNALVPNNRNILYFNFPYKANSKSVDVVIDRSKLSDVNLWREMRYPESLLISDRLHNELKQRKITFFKPLKARVIDTSQSSSAL